ncbi:MAG: NADH-quinone oxidoreductase subunit 1 [Alphaproteobacteria bacterium MarineAlpha5_Bin5]|nr:MAG: NADH-quinone oxidoreductase subunit 1 [Alphaproteobacteria bacterium MarineAlpha5_Bin5]|tara:strand:- start:3492 stop:5195 length:1704 start_codon:yes stop_codon:yes gene_type:complete
MNKFISQTETSLIKKKKRWTPKGRQVEDIYFNEVSQLFRGKIFKRDELIEYLHILQDNFGVLFDKHLVALSSIINLPLSEIYEVATFYAHFNIVKDRPDYNSIKVVRVCESLTCELFGAQKLLAELKKLQNKNLKVVPGPCMGRCEVAPTVCVGKNYVDNASLKDVKKTIDNKLFETVVPNYINLENYKKHGGYEITKKIKNGQITDKQILDILNESGLKGKGGAGFPTGKKWEIVSKYKGEKYVAVNGDEGEPGTFKDRFYLEKDPHRFLEGALIASIFIKASKVYIYIRDEYPAIIKILYDEIKILEKEKIISENHFIIRRGAGAYICGEESAMIESIEGKRGLPRHRPPYVAESGLFGLPTLTNNLETLYWIRDIIERGSQWFAEKGFGGKKGFHSFSVSGRVKDPGVKVAPAGITIQELIDKYCGGMKDGHIFKGYLPGGASGGILPASMNNIPLDYGSKELTDAGCFLGSAAIVVLSDKDNMKKVALNLLKFFEEESCGQCTPCRSGTEKTVKLMKEKNWNKEKLADLSEVMAQASICGLGQAATNPLNSVLRYFENEIDYE